MNISIKGVTSLEIIQNLTSVGVNEYCFDLRPKSFNFVQGHKIKTILDSAIDSNNYSLIFENEKDFMVNELFKDIDSHTSNLDVEFSSVSDIKNLLNTKSDFSWHYSINEKINEVEKIKHLKKIVFKHKLLEEFSDRGELFGFLQLFSDFPEHIKFEILIDWDTELIESMFSYFNFHSLGFEINSKVEKSYQNADVELIKSQVLFYQSLFKGS